MANPANRSGESVGRIELICGPMFSGKSTALIRKLSAAADGGATVIACKPARDTRYATDRIVTHDGAGITACEITGADDLRERVRDAAVVGIDEFHFFDMPVVEACTALAGEGKRVICAGVDLDHRGEMFDVMEAVSNKAADVERLTATCAVCGAVATFTQRLIESDARIVVGGAGDYEPRCENCFDCGKAKGAR